MEDFFNSTQHYKSGWRPLARETDSNVLSTYKNIVTPGTKDVTEINKPDETGGIPENSDILKLLSEISEKIDALNGCINRQSENINDMFSLIKEELEANRRNTFGFLKK